MPTIIINDRTIQADDGQSVLETATAAGITIPTLCYHKDLSIDGSCRLCMVEDDSVIGQVAACTTPIHDGMVIRTETPELAESRRFVLEMLLRNYHDSSGEGIDNEFTRWVRHYGANLPTDAPTKPRYSVDGDPNPFIRVDLNQCILCTRCVRACEEIQGRFVWGVGYRGHDAKIIAGADTTMLEARCESCGACEAYCPTGALTDRMSFGQGRPDRTVATTCGYCGVGCQFDLNVKDNRIIGVMSNPSAPVNGMSLCVKGRYGWDFVHHKDRLTTPLVRRPVLEGKEQSVHGDRGEWIEVDWDRAMRLVAEKLVTVKREDGPDAIGVLSSAKCTNEENYLMQKFARQVIGTNNIDHCARLCHSSTVAGLAMAFGSGAMSNSMRDIVDDAAAIFIIGSNTTEQHPVFGAMIRQAVLRRGVKLLVADPRKIDITEFATLHIRQRPGTDVALINGLMHIVLQDAWHDKTFITERCEGFEDFRETIQQYPAQRVADITGVSVADLQNAAELLASNHPLAVIWAMGITQHTTGVMNVLSLANLQMLLGNMGVAGGGVNPLRGQNNVQGACDLGALPNVLPGYQSVTSDEVIAKFDGVWKAGSGSIAGKTPGLTVTEMIEAAGRGEIRALYILGEDPVLTEPDSNHVRKSMEASEFIVLQEIFPSETSHYADVLLPAASFAEKSGTFTNTERRIQLIHPAVDPPGDARADWRITSDLARKVLALESRQPTGPLAAWDYASATEIMDEIAAVTPSYAGVSHSRLEHGDQLQWPVLDKGHPGTPILHVGQFKRGKGRFHAIDHLPAKELPDEQFPLLLTTGRVLYHWHGGELSRRAQGLLEACPETLLEISPDDAARLGINDNSPVRVVSRRGEMTARAVITDRVSEGVVFGNFHFPGSQNINNVTIGALDPIAKIPEYKVCAVAVERL
jgi:formate dehydrogenase alpha subunit